MIYYTGIEIGGTKLQIIVGDNQLQIVERYRFEVDREKGAEGIRELIENTLKNEILKKYNPVSIGVGYGGPVDHISGKIRVSHHVEGWSGFELGGWLNEISGIAVRIDNDANTAALAEAVLGEGKLYSKVFYVTLGSGMGGGFVMDKRLYHGKIPGESEIGLVSFDKSGVNFESHCSGWAIDRKIRNYVSDYPDSIFAGLLDGIEKSEASYLLPARNKGDVGAIQILDSLADDLAFGLSHVTHLFNPEIIVIGGGLSLIGEPLLSPVRNYIGKYLTTAFQPGPEIEVAAFGEDVVGIGALLHAREVYKQSVLIH